MFKMWYWVLTCFGDLDLFVCDLGKYLLQKPRKNATCKMIGLNFLQWYDKNSINDKCENVLEIVSNHKVILVHWNENFMTMN